jgi:hypothetical protein
MQTPTGQLIDLARRLEERISRGFKHKGRSLPYRTFDKVRQVDQAAIVENKRLGPLLAYIAERQQQMNMSRSQKAPRRPGQGQSLFKVG